MLLFWNVHENRMRKEEEQNSSVSSATINLVENENSLSDTSTGGGIFGVEGSKDEYKKALESFHQTSGPFDLFDDQFEETQNPYGDDSF